MAKVASKQRWIMYAQMNIPCNLSFRVTCHESLEWCMESLRRYSNEVCYNDVSAQLYVYSDEAWKTAREFEGIGCPFDYPEKQIERGPRGALRVERC